MTPRDRDVITRILVAEGWPVYTDRAADRGGPTKGGITLMTLRAYGNQKASVTDLQALTREQAEAIYFTVYVVPFAWIDDDKLFETAVDWCVTSGPRPVTRALQRLTGVPVDGILGKKTYNAVNDFIGHDDYYTPGQNCDLLITRLIIARLQYTGAIMNNFAKLPHTSLTCQGRNAEGWINRIVRFLPDYDHTCEV